MKIVGILKNYIIIEPQYAGDCETYIQLTDAGMEELRYTFNVKEYRSIPDFHGDYFYGISEEEYVKQVEEANSKVAASRLDNFHIDDADLPF